MRRHYLRILDAASSSDWFWGYCYYLLVLPESARLLCQWEQEELVPSVTADTLSLELLDDQDQNAPLYKRISSALDVRVLIHSERNLQEDRNCCKKRIRGIPPFDSFQMIGMLLLGQLRPRL